MRPEEDQSRPLAKAMRKAMTKAEVVPWTRLRELNLRGWKFRRQHPIGPYVADFVHIRGRLVIEIDGDTHATEEGRAHDRGRDDYLLSQGWEVMRFTNNDVYLDVTAVIEQITGRLPLTRPDATRRPTSPASGRG
ncbi:MAG: endonuclease domain-containing protein [Rhizomicrobium sp.]